MILFNALAALILTVALILGGVAVEVFDDHDPFFGAITICAVALDLLWRFTRGRTQAIEEGGDGLPIGLDIARSLFHPTLGGHVFFVPLWFATVSLFMLAHIGGYL